MRLYNSGGGGAEGIQRGGTDNTLCFRKSLPGSICGNVGGLEGMVHAAGGAVGRGDPIPLQSFRITSPDNLRRSGDVIATIMALPSEDCPRGWRPDGAH